MKILHTSDLHINSPLTARLPQDKVRERKQELIMTFARMVDEAVYQKARLFIIAGDLFDSERLTKSVAERVIGIIEKNPAVDFLYLPGNHEKSALSSCGIPLPQNLRIFGEDWTYFNYGYVTVAGRSSIEQGMFEHLELNYANTNIVVLHGALSDGRTNGEYIGLRDTDGKHIDYIALGHYHSYGVADGEDGCIAVYSGTPEGRGFDEAGEKGFVMIDADGKRVHHTFAPFAKRTLRIIDVDITGAERHIDVEDRVAASLDGVPLSNLIRIRLTGSHKPEFFCDTDALTSAFSGRFYHFEVKDDSVTDINPETYMYDKSLKGEFIRLVLSKEDMSKEEKDKVIRTGLAALMGEADRI